MTLDEQALRLPAFTPGTPIVLRDGQTWHFPRPMVPWRRSWRDDIPMADAYTSLGHGYDAAMKVLKSSDAPPPDPIGLAMELASAMLTANYGLGREDLSGLLVYDPGDPEDGERWHAILSVALGDSPRTPGRWRYLATWLALGPPSDRIDLADLNDYIDLIVGSGRGVPSERWVTAGRKTRATAREVCDAMEEAARQGEVAFASSMRAGGDVSEEFGRRQPETAGPLAARRPE